MTSLVLDGCTRLWELRFANNGLSGELDLSPFSLTRIASEGNRLETIYVPQDFDPDATYFMGRSRNAAPLHERRGNGLGQEIGNRDERPFMEKNVPADGRNVFFDTRHPGTCPHPSLPAGIPAKRAPYSLTHNLMEGNSNDRLTD